FDPAASSVVARRALGKQPAPVARSAADVPRSGRLHDQGAHREPLHRAQQPHRALLLVPHRPLRALVPLRPRQGTLLTPSSSSSLSTRAASLFTFIFCYLFSRQN